MPMSFFISSSYPLRFLINFFGGEVMLGINLKTSFYMGIFRGSPGRIIIYRREKYTCLLYRIKLCLKLYPYLLLKRGFLIEYNRTKLLNSLSLFFKSF